MRNSMYKLIGVLIILSFVLVACAPADEPAPQEPAPGDNNAQQPADGIAGLAMTNRISEEWKQSGKMFAVPSVAAREACAVACHDGYAFSTGEFTDPEQFDEEGMHFVGIDCQSCHSGTGQELMDTGLVSVPFADEEIQAGTGALCITCHHGRRDTRAIYEEYEGGGATRFSYPHYGPAALTTGMGGVEYPDVEYGHTPAHGELENTCLTCHMPQTADGYRDHTFQMDEQYAGQTCGGCHSGITDWNLNGFQDQVQEWVSQLEEAIFEETGSVYISSGGGQLIFYADEARTETLTPDQVSLEAFIAAYNVYLIRTEGSWGVHNPAYTRSLLQESYRALTGDELQ
ncbi:ammonia-forming cytochrome c nitrite reductase subunit c552 [Desulfuribacillus alkaliarsenatis]|uniref:Uncharacterized protein n=1 Tax=Desulfuribacillus alkaliarsenatis TaxID=766136 RepID=A0A1E5G490_9FIRM|nr:ammonia-forming cytochrome c nitrite reductase subunit c552 [Desulfuribacillus alkaliarsenatis]OEF97903.1 hypothetical protein BHF68_12590 [Desulfuribacillus alkaliarsenatis]